MDTIQNQVAEIYAIEDAGVQIKLKDKNKRSLGSFFKQKKDGNPSQAWQQFQDMELKSGSVVEISFKLNPDKNDPKIVYKNIIGFRETNEQAQSYQAPPDYPNYEKKDIPVNLKVGKATVNPLEVEPKDDKFWQKRAYKQCLWNYWLEKVALQDQQNWMDEVWQVFNQIDQDADKRFREVNPENIPF